MPRLDRMPPLDVFEWVVKVFDTPSWLTAHRDPLGSEGWHGPEQILSLGSFLLDISSGSSLASLLLISILKCTPETQGD